MIFKFKSNQIYKSSKIQLKDSGISLKEYNDFLLLRTMHKSGTNFLRLLLSNYLYNLGKNTFELVEYDQVHFDFFPNVRMHVIQKKVAYQRPSDSHFIKKLGFSDFIYDHGSELDFDPNLHAKKTIYLYRNPLDLMISQYYYFFENRVDANHSIDHPRYLIDTNLPSFCKYYNLMLKRSESFPEKYKVISYESIKEKTEETFSDIIKFIGLKFDASLVDFSIEAASIKQVKKTEAKLGHAIHQPKKTFIKGSFARSGKIGQWQNYFDSNDLEQIRDILKENNLNLNNFQTKE